MRSYRGMGQSSGGLPDIQVHIKDIDMGNLIATAETANGRGITIDLARAPLGVISLPHAGEYWYVAKLSGEYVLTRRGKVQNQAILATDKRQGDVLYANPLGRIRLSDGDGTVPRIGKAIKDASETRTVGGAMTDDTDLQVLSLQANSLHGLKAMLFWNAGAVSSHTANINMRYPSGTIIKGAVNGATAFQGAYTQTVSITGLVVTYLEGMIRVGSTPGDLVLQWQVTSGATAVTLQSDSFLQIEAL
jgi:hypothetical protein